MFRRPIARHALRALLVATLSSGLITPALTTTIADPNTTAMLTGQIIRPDGQATDSSDVVDLYRWRKGAIDGLDGYKQVASKPLAPDGTYAFSVSQGGKYGVAIETSGSDQAAGYYSTYVGGPTQTLMSENLRWPGSLYSLTPGATTDAGTYSLPLGGFLGGIVSCGQIDTGTSNLVFGAKVGSSTVQFSGYVSTDADHRITTAPTPPGIYNLSIQQYGCSFAPKSAVSYATARVTIRAGKTTTYNVSGQTPAPKTKPSLTGTFRVGHAIRIGLGSWRAGTHVVASYFNDDADGVTPSSAGLERRYTITKHDMTTLHPRWTVRAYVVATSPHAFDRITSVRHVVQR